MARRKSGRQRRGTATTNRHQAGRRATRRSKADGNKSSRRTKTRPVSNTGSVTSVEKYTMTFTSEAWKDIEAAALRRMMNGYEWVRDVIKEALVAQKPRREAIRFENTA